MAFWSQADYDAKKNLTEEEVKALRRGEKPQLNSLGNLPSSDIDSGTSMGQAMKYFKKAGITEQVMDKFWDPSSKWYGNEAYLSSQAGASGAEDFKDGMSFIKNAKSSANLARNMMMNEQAQRNQGMSPDDYNERGEHWTDTSGDSFNVGPDYETGEHWPIDDTPYDITADLGGDDYYTKGEHWEDTSNDLYGDRLYESGEMMPDEQYSLGDWGFYNEKPRFGNYKDMDRKFGDLSKRNSGFIAPFNRNTNLPFNPNALLPRVNELNVNPNIIGEDEDELTPAEKRALFSPR